MLDLTEDNLELLILLPLPRISTQTTNMRCHTQLAAFLEDWILNESVASNFQKLTFLLFLRQGFILWSWLA